MSVVNSRKLIFFAVALVVMSAGCSSLPPREPQQTDLPIETTHAQHTTQLSESESFTVTYTDNLTTDSGSVAAEIHREVNRTESRGFETTTIRSDTIDIDGQTFTSKSNTYRWTEYNGSKNISTYTEPYNNTKIAVNLTDAVELTHSKAVLAGFYWTERQTREFDGESVTVYETTEIASDRAVQSLLDTAPQNDAEISGQLYLGERGLIRYVELSYTDAERTNHIQIAVQDVGTTTVTTPEWIEHDSDLFETNK